MDRVEPLTMRTKTTEKKDERSSLAVIVMHSILAVEKIKPEKSNSDLDGIQTQDRSDTGAVLTPTDLSSQLGAGHFVSSSNTRRWKGQQNHK